ncbi:TMM81 protein, partial [Alcedo cyanopectus]|nr:TMM81 protein [Ceyx cyanopectus]
VKTLGVILGLSLCSFCLLLKVPLGEITIPEELKTVVAKVIVNTTSCSVTCGLGVKVEELCEITPAGERKNCTLRRSSCLSPWLCGLRHFTIPLGQPFQGTCQTSDVVDFENGAYNYTWGFAPGLITTNDLLFKTFKHPYPYLRLSPAKEADAGTYRCDVLMLKTLKVVKRIYFGVKVIPNDMADLNFHRSLTWEQKLLEEQEEELENEENAENAETPETPEYSEYPENPENHTQVEVQQEEQQQFWQVELFIVCLIGVGSGVVGGVLVSTALYVLKVILRR